MRHRWTGFAVLVTVCLMVASGQAAEFSGTIGADVVILPDLGAGMDFGVTLSGDAWSLLSDTNIDLVPAFGGREEIALTYNLDVIRLAASVAMSFVPFSFDGADVAGTVDVLDLTIRDEDPLMILSSDVTIGAAFDGEISPYAWLYSKLCLGNHWLSNTTTFGFVPFDVTSTLLGYVLLGEFPLLDGAITVKTYGYLSLGIVPFDFTYAQLNAKVILDGVSILNTVTYHGDTSFAVTSTVTVDLDPVTLAMWGSYNSTAADPFGIGLSVSFGWGPL